MIVVVMGVSGAGKTTVGRLLAERLGFAFAEGDDYHPAANVEKMRGGAPLDEDDRRPWLAALAGEIAHWRASRRDVVLACSALKTRYRELLRDGADDVRFVHLAASRESAAARLRARRGHFMPPALLESQLATLEPPGPEEGALLVDAEQSPAQIVEQVAAQLRGAASLPAGVK